MKAKYKVGDAFRLKKDHTFTRGFRMGGFNKDGSVAEIDKEHSKAGGTAKVSVVYDLADRAEPRYRVDLGEIYMDLTEAELLELFDAV